MKYLIPLIFFCAIACRTKTPEKEPPKADIAVLSSQDSIVNTTKTPSKESKKNGEFQGELYEVVWGDYGHLVVQKEEIYKSFWLRGNIKPELLEKLEDPAQQGRSINVFYTDTIHQPEQADVPSEAMFLDNVIVIGE